MKFVFNILLIAGFVALSHAACEVCTCTEHPPYFTQEFVEEFQFPGLTITSVQPTDFHIDNCVLSLKCNFGDEPEIGTEHKIEYFPFLSDGQNITSYTSDLTQLKCVGGQWTFGGVPVQYVGCTIHTSTYVP